MHKAGPREVLDVIREKEMRIKSNTKIASRDIGSESRREEVADRCNEVSGDA